MSRLMYILPPHQIEEILNSDQFIPAASVDRWVNFAARKMPNKSMAIFYRKEGTGKRSLALHINDEIAPGEFLPHIKMTSRHFSDVGYFESLKLMKITASKENSQNWTVFVGLRKAVQENHCAFCDSSTECKSVDNCDISKFSADSGLIYNYDVAILETRRLWRLPL